MHADRDFVPARDARPAQQGQLPSTSGISLPKTHQYIFRPPDEMVDFCYAPGVGANGQSLGVHSQVEYHKKYQLLNLSNKIAIHI